MAAWGGPDARDLKAGPSREHHIRDLYEALKDLSEHEFPYVESPPETKKRASVALILRVNPTYAHPPTSDSPPRLPKRDEFGDDAPVAEQLGAFFAQEWVQHGDAEVLFIKRATRQGDRWNGHVALPGGRRDPEDSDDAAAAVRETSEEVGLDLTADAIAAGNLPQRVVCTSWGKTPLMVLCPYVYVLRRPHAPLSLQPTEVASAYWVPMRGLLAPSLRVWERQDVSSRLARSELGLQRWLFRGALGHMLFSAILLTPSTSVHTDPLPSFADASSTAASTASQPSFLRRLLFDADAAAAPPPLHLWGLTLGVVADLLELIPPHAQASLQAYPTFAAPDVRFAIWLLSARFRARRAAEARGRAGTLNPGNIEIAAEAAISRRGSMASPRRGSDISSGLGATGSRARMLAGRRHEMDPEAFATTLEQYYDYVRGGIALALGVRVAAFAGGVAWVYYRYWPTGGGARQ